MIVKISKPYAIYEIGQRDNQEDSIFPKYGEATEDNKVFVLCDGMGGHKNGEVASSMVCDFMSNFILSNWDETGFTDSMLSEALNGALDKLEILNDKTTRLPGTTLTLLVFHKGGVLAAHIGDSRIYHIRPSEKRLLYKSRDHSQVYDMLASGEISLREVDNYKKKNIVTRALIPGQERRTKPSIAHITDVHEGDIFFMCSDGMLENMSDDVLVEHLSSDKSDEEKRDSLVKSTEGNKDNHSAYIIKVNTVEIEEGDEILKNDEQTTPSNALLLEKDYVNNYFVNSKQIISKRHHFSYIYLLFVLLLLGIIVIFVVLG